MNSTLPPIDKTSPLRIAIVDDDPPMLRLLGLWAKSMGFEPLLIGLGQDLLRVDLTGFVAVCLDLNLGDGDIAGLDVLRHIKARDARLPVVVITAERQVDTAVKAMRMGAVDYVTKPLEMTRFNQALLSAIERHPKRDRLDDLENNVAALRERAAISDPRDRPSWITGRIPPPKSSETSVWMEIEISRAGSDVRVTARGSRSEQTAPVTLPLSFEAIKQFASGVRGAAKRGKSLAAHLIETAQSLSRSILGPQIETLRARLSEASRGRLLVRFAIADSEIQAVPWEALCKVGQGLGFWASSADLLPVRGVTTSAPWSPSAVGGALRILAIAPTTGASLFTLQSALFERINAGEVEWLPPLEEAAATATNLFDRLRREPVPHVLHFIGHGGLENGHPVLRLADDADGNETWLPVELLAQQLEANLEGVLRLIVLEACEGARPGAFASAAEILARAGADAVTAHLWPVRADVARVFSKQLYRALSGADRGRGDIANAMNEARRAILGSFETSAEAFSPVVYLRGPDGVIFNFDERQIVALRPTAPIPPNVAMPSEMDAKETRSFTPVNGTPWCFVTPDRPADSVRPPSSLKLPPGSRRNPR